MQVPPGLSSIENGAHGIEKLLLKTQVSLISFLHSEVNKLIQHIIVQVQDGQNNNKNKDKRENFFFLYLVLNDLLD